MKFNKKNILTFNSLSNNKGFTIIETLFSLLLVSLALVFISQVIISSINGQRKSNIWFNMQQEIETCRAKLVSKSFDDIELAEGSYSTTSGMLQMSWNIKNISPTLKLIQLAVRYKQITKKAFFYKSKYIKNNESTTNGGRK
jgi:hypothetical protein